MAAASETYSSSASDGGLIALLGQERYEDYFSTGEDGGVVVGGASDTDWWKPSMRTRIYSR